jgi:hypothetical protein
MGRRKYFCSTSPRPSPHPRPFSTSGEGCPCVSSLTIGNSVPTNSTISLCPAARLKTRIYQIQLMHQLRLGTPSPPRGEGVGGEVIYPTFAAATGRAIVPLWREGKSGQQRAMYRLSAGVIYAWANDTDSATENNFRRLADKVKT